MAVHTRPFSPVRYAMCIRSVYLTGRDGCTSRYDTDSTPEGIGVHADSAQVNLVSERAIAFLLRVCTPVCTATDLSSFLLNERAFSSLECAPLPVSYTRYTYGVAYREEGTRSGQNLWLTSDDANLEGEGEGGGGGDIYTHALFPVRYVIRSQCVSHTEGF